MNGFSLNIILCDLNGWKSLMIMVWHQTDHGPFTKPLIPEFHETYSWQGEDDCRVRLQIIIFNHSALHGNN